ncbi:UTP--glucose-1-phosphate uridylyltransferase [Paenibacillus sp. CECT 9249]|nr:UTP--glucose-1-phosphate uridylyltransferase [Paenibacillus sp. CECT 9249]
MKAVIMAGGKGTRLRPLTLDTPKPMVPLLNRPCMEYIIELLKSSGITDIAVTVQYLPEVIRGHFGDGAEFGVDLRYFEETEPLGTAGSIKNAESFLDEPFIVISGDALTDFQLRDAIAYHGQKKALATLVLTRVPTPLEYGVVMTDREGRITRFLEKPSWSEVFSDTVNTGIYILDPSIFAYMHPGEICDFSMDLFPALLRDNAPLYGYVAEGYWSDIGTLQQYRQTQFDMLDRKVNVRIAADEVLPGIYMENNINLPERVKCIGPAYIGTDCTIENDAIIGEYSVLGKSNRVSSAAATERSIIWNGNYIGRQSEVRGALLCHRTNIGDGVQLHEGVVVGTGSEIGSKATVKSNVKIWPDKRIQSNAVLHSSMIWNEQADNQLFRGQGISGVPNVDMTPEFAGKLASAYGSTLRRGATIGMCRSPHPFAGMMQSAFAAGLQSAGIHVMDLGIASDAVCRHAVQTLRLDGAVYLRQQRSGRGSKLNIEFIDKQGYPLAKNQERKIENAYRQEDYARSESERIGHLRSYEYAEADYMQELCGEIRFHTIGGSGIKIVLQYDPRDHGRLIEHWSQRLGCKRIVIHSDQEQGIAYHVVKNEADIGIHFHGSHQGVTIVTHEGKPVKDELLLALKVLAFARTERSGVLGIPVSAPQIVEAVAAGSGVRIVRTKENARALLEASEDLVFHPLLDNVYAVSLILETLAREKLAFAELLRHIPDFHMAKQEIPCAWDDKGMIMRQMMSEAEHKTIELVDGIKIYSEEGWVLILPDQDEPAFRIIAQAKTALHAQNILSRYTERIKNSHQSLRK